MDIWTNLSPAWQQFLVGTAGNALGGFDPIYRDEKVFARLVRTLEEDKDP